MSTTGNRACRTVRSASTTIDAGHSVNVGDEGGFAPDLRTAEEALDFVVRAIEQSGYKPGSDITIVMDPARRSSSATASTTTRARASAAPPPNTPRIWRSW